MATRRGHDPGAERAITPDYLIDYRGTFQLNVRRCEDDPGQATTGLGLPDKQRVAWGLNRIGHGLTVWVTL